MLIGNTWRRERDSNPRDAYTPTRFPSVRLQPLGHPSVELMQSNVVRKQRTGRTIVICKPLARPAEGLFV